MTYRGAQNLIKRGDEAGLRAALEQWTPVWVVVDGSTIAALVLPAT